MTFTATGIVSGNGALAQAINRFGRRSIAQTLRANGNEAKKRAGGLASLELGPPRPASRRHGGRHYHTAFEAEYNGLDDIDGSGKMIVRLINHAPHANIIEHGSGGHMIFPADEESRLAWPDPPWAEGEAAFVGQKGEGVFHPGTPAFAICERAIRGAVREKLDGRTLGRAHVVVVVD